jgi:hypothetical protein
MKIPREKIIRNSVKCLKCGEEIESKSVHDFRSCKCGNISVDGGKEYLRRVGNYEECEDTSITEPMEPFDTEKDSLTGG